VTLYFQRESPGAEKEANWLPAPMSQFIPMLRMYRPKENNPSILNGARTPPAVVKASCQSVSRNIGDQPRYPTTPLTAR
jgi:hypothetical protein